MGYPRRFWSAWASGTGERSGRTGDNHRYNDSHPLFCHPGCSGALLRSPGPSWALLLSPGPSWVLLGFHGSSWALWALLGTWALQGPPGLSWALLGTWASWAPPGPSRLPLGSHGLSWALLGSPGLGPSFRAQCLIEHDYTSIKYDYTRIPRSQYCHNILINHIIIENRR